MIRQLERLYTRDIGDEVSETITQIYHAESRRILATLIRLLGDMDMAEDALHNAFRTAMEQWPQSGIPANPSAWLISTGRFKAIDSLRKDNRDYSVALEMSENPGASLSDDMHGQENPIEDDRLRLIFTCCHPSLPPEAQIAMTLREMCGLTTEEIASAFLIPPSTLAQRIVRAKSKIRADRIPYVVPALHEMPIRLDAVLRVIYLIFNEGYSASCGMSVTRSSLSVEAIRLGRLLTDLLDDPEAVGLLALMLLQESRRLARTKPDGSLVLLGDQDRSLWNQDMIAEGRRLIHLSRSRGSYGLYSLQATIALHHANAATSAETNWASIVDQYDHLMEIAPTPIVELNRAVAIAMRDGPRAGLQQINLILDRGDLKTFHLAHSARADMYRQLELNEEARASYKVALSLTQQEPEKQFLLKRLSELG